MTTSLRKNAASGMLRSIRKYRDWNEYAYDMIPSQYALARDCDCCELLPTDVVPGSLVDTGEATTVTGSGSAHYTAFFTEGYGNFQDRYIPSVSWSWGGVGTCGVTLYPPLQIVPPAGFALHYLYGTNLNWCLVLAASLGTASQTQWHEYQTEGEEPAGGDITAEASFGARLFAYIEEVGRVNPNRTVWGPRPRYNDSQTKDAVDLRGYKNADMAWYYWDQDASGGTVTVSAFGHELTIAGSGPPQPISTGSALMVNIEPGVQDEEEEWLESSLSMTFFGSPDLPEMTRSAYAAPPDDNGAIARTSGNAVYLKCDGVNTSNFRRATLSLSAIQPEREVSVELELVTPHGLDPGTIAVTPYSGPDRTQWGGRNYAVNSAYPVDDPYTPGADEGVPIALSAPGSWSGAGRSYSVQAMGFVNAPAQSFGVMNESSDTIGDPAFGFAFSPAALEAAGMSGDNWRCPLRVPAAAATWTAARLRRQQPRFPDEAGWAPGADTEIEGPHVTGEGTLTISQTLGAAWLVKDYRWLVIRMAGSEVGQTITLAIGSKSWTRTLPETEDDVTFDLCNPTNGSGFDTTTSVLQVRAAQGGWGWGVDGAATLTLSTDAPFWVYGTRLSPSDLPGLLLVGETLHRWRGEFEVGQIVLNEGGTYEETITTYAARGLLYLHDGRIVLDEEWGLTADGFQWDKPDYRAYLALNIGDVIRAANVRQENRAAAAVALLEDRKPARFFERVGWDGAFRWVDHEEFWNNHAEAYHLRPARVSVDGGTVDLMADYCVDRIAPGVGVSCTLTSRKWLSGGLHGITSVNGEAQAAAISAGASDAVSRADGLYQLPGDALLASNQSHSLSAGWNGSPAQTVVEGTMMRVTVRK